MNDGTWYDYCTVFEVHLRFLVLNLKRRVVRVLLQSGSALWEHIPRMWRGSNAGSHLAFSCHALLVSYGLPQLHNACFVCLIQLWCYWTFILYRVSEFESVWCFLRIRLKLCIFAKNTIWMKLHPFQAIIWGGIWYQHHLLVVVLTLISCFNWCLPDFSTIALLFPSLQKEPCVGIFWV